MVITLTGIVAFSEAEDALFEASGFFFDEQAERISPLISIAEIDFVKFIISVIKYYFLLHIIQEFIKIQLCLQQVHESRNIAVLSIKEKGVCLSKVEARGHSLLVFVLRAAIYSL